MPDENVSKEKLHKSYKPSQAMISAAKRGLAARQKANDSDKGGFDAKEAKAQGVGSGVARARDIINGNLSLNTVKRIYSFLSRAKTYYKPDKRTASGGYTPGTQAYWLWGGTSGLAWARNILEEEGVIKKSELQAELISKSVIEEKRLATFVVLEPQNPDGTTTDLHLDWYDAEMIEEACFNFNTTCRKANIMHSFDTEGFEFVESYVCPADITLANKQIKKGTWIATIRVSSEPEHQWIWDGIKKGQFNGLSIQGLGMMQKMENKE